MHTNTRLDDVTDGERLAYGEHVILYAHRNNGFPGSRRLEQTIEDRIESNDPLFQGALATTAAVTTFYIASRYGEMLQPLVGAMLRYF